MAALFLGGSIVTRVVSLSRFRNWSEAAQLRWYLKAAIRSLRWLLKS